MSLSKVFETLLFRRMKPLIIEKNIIPDHQFRFRQHHSTIEQVNRVYAIARKAIEEKKYCTAVFLDISQAFDKVWHPGLLCKLQKIFPENLFKILKSYLSQRYYLVKEKQETTKIFPILSGVPQGSVLGPVLYTIFTADLPLNSNTYTATFADDTVIMAIHKDPYSASELIQRNLDSINIWMKLWRMKANESKSTQITFTLKKQRCPPVKVNNIAIPQANDVKYLGIHLDQRLTWQIHIMQKRKQLGIKLRNIYWLLGKSSKLSLDNKILIYKVIVKPIWIFKKKYKHKVH